MSTGNMAANWRQSNDVIAPGWCKSEHPLPKYDVISIFKMAVASHVVFVLE